MDQRPGKQLHETVGFLGLRAHATAVGLLHLTTELYRAGVLDDAAICRIKDAIFSDLALQRPPARPRHIYEQTLKHRLDQLFPSSSSGCDKL